VITSQAEAAYVFFQQLTAFTISHDGTLPSLQEASLHTAGGGIWTFPGLRGWLRTLSRRKAERDKSAHQQKGLSREQHEGLLLCN